MLLAPNDPTPTSPRSAPLPTAREEANFNYLLIGLCMALVTFCLFTGLGLASGRVPAARAFLLMTPVPLALALWFAFGAWRSRLLDRGLLLSSGGWLLVFLTLLVKHFAVQSALAARVPLSQVGDSPIVWALAILSLALVGAGAWLSWQTHHAAPR